jgi:hypothetical protein
MIPIGSNYPTSIDTNQNLFQVHDSLRMQLIEDYNPGDTSITVFGDATIMDQFDSTGIITLTEQCSDPELRAISFFYNSKTDTTFDGLEILPGFTDVIKPANITNVTQNVMALGHNNLKDALIAIQHMAGRQGEAPTQPLQGTMEQRITYLRNLVLTPKAWFTVDQTLGLAPFTVTFTDQSFLLGTDGTSHTVTHIWDFGDNTGPSIITIEEDTVVPPDVHNVLVSDSDGGTITKTYNAGIFSPTLTVTNDFGSDTITFPNMINARYPAPDYATIEFIQGPGQLVTSGLPIGGPYTTPPKIRATINTLINIYVPNTVNSNTGNSDAGEVLDGLGNPLDPISSYIWSFSDDLGHNNASTATALFSIGGTYDLVLRTNTKFGAYRITDYSHAFDIIENVNLWLWTYGTGNNVYSCEFGLISETFKTNGTTPLTLNQDDSFLTGAPNEFQQKKEFLRNNGFTQRGSANSGNGGVGLLYWASGRTSMETASSEEIVMSEYNGFFDTYTNRPSISRPWNWVGLSSTQNLYFILGGITGAIAPSTSPTNQIQDTFNLASLTDSQIAFSNANYKNGANELTTNEVTFDIDGNAIQGNMSVYRSAWLNETGYFLRNEGVGTFFRIISFYGTSGNSTSPFQYIQKLPDMVGSAKLEGQLVALSQGLYFFNNSGSVSAYSPISGIWGTGGPGTNSSNFTMLQDTGVVGFNLPTQTLLAASDGDATAYLSFDYSSNAFMKFTEVDTTFSAVTARPVGTQWQMSIF